MFTALLPILLTLSTPLLASPVPNNPQPNPNAPANPTSAFEPVYTQPELSVAVSLNPDGTTAPAPTALFSSCSRHSLPVMDIILLWGSGWGSTDPAPNITSTISSSSDTGATTSTSPSTTSASVPAASASSTPGELSNSLASALKKCGWVTKFETVDVPTQKRVWDTSTVSGEQGTHFRPEWGVRFQLAHMFGGEGVGGPCLTKVIKEYGGPDTKCENATG